MRLAGFGTHLTLLCSVWQTLALNFKAPSINNSTFLEWSQIFAHYKKSPVNQFFGGFNPAPASAGIGILIDKQIVGGTEATRGQWPWMVKIFMDETMHCGGSLICAHWVLTAGHCVYNVNTIDVYLGAHNWSAASEEGRQIQTTKVRKLHPKYNHDILANDIALIRLPQKVEMNKFINFVRLPKKSDLAQTFVGTRTAVSGWGLNKDNGSASEVLNFLKDMEVISNEECSKNYGNIDVSILCIEGANNQSTCGGDSGGPLVYQEEDKKWTQIGIVSFGDKQSCVGFPQGFTRVTHYLGWISMKTGLKIAK